MIRMMMDVPLRRLKRKMHFHKGIKNLLVVMTAAGGCCFILSLISLYMVIPFLQGKLLMILSGSVILSCIASLLMGPSRMQVMITADSLGFKERIMTAWYLREDTSPVAELQRQDTQSLLESRKERLHQAYGVKYSKRQYVPALVLVLMAFSLSFVPGKVFQETQLRESLITEMKTQEKLLEEKVKEEMQKHPQMSEEQLKQLQEALEKLKEEFKKAKTEEDALKALARMENDLERLAEENPLKALNDMENALDGSPLTEELAEALKNKDQEELKDALEELKKALEEAENQAELAAFLEKAAQQMAGNAEISQALQQMASAAASGSAGVSEMAESLSEMLKQAEKNAQGQGSFNQAAASMGEASKQARRAISSVDGSVAMGAQGQSNSQGKDSSAEGQGQGQGQGEQGGQGTGQGQNAGAGAGAGEGSTHEDQGYQEGDEPGSGRAPGERKENEYRSIYVPERLGGEGNEFTLSGQKLESGSSTFNETDGAPVQKGAMLPWQEIISEYREEAVRAMDQQEIPPGMRALVRDYFSSLE